MDLQMNNVSTKDIKIELVKRFGTADYAVFGCMLAVSAIIGIYYAFVDRKKATTKEMLMGGRSMSVFPVAMSVLASFMSAVTLLGTPAEIYTYGTQYWMIIIGYLFLIPVAAHVYLPVFYALELTSAYEYLERRFNRFVRTLASMTFSLQMILYMAVVLYAPSLALSQVTGIGVWTSVLSIGIVCTFYTTIGGIKAVVWTDLFQILMMFAAMFAVVIKGVMDEGGISKVWQANYEGGRIEFFNFGTDPRNRHTVWSLAIGGYFTWLANYGCNQAMVQRYLSVPKKSGAQTAIWWNLPGLSLLLTICSLAGMVIYSKYRHCDPITTKSVDATDQLFPLFVMDTLGEYRGVPGLFVAGIFSGALSTVSSGVNSLAAVTLEDVIKAYIAPGISELWATRWTRILALVYGAISILLVLVAERLGQVLQAALSLFGMIGGPLLGLFTLGMFFPWPNSTGAITGLLSGLFLSFWIGFGAFAHKPIIPKLPTSVAACAFNVSASIGTTTPATPSDDPLIELYRVSYMWYSAIGCTTVVVVGLIVSFISGPNKADAIDPKLMTPFFYNIFFWLPPGLRNKLRLGVHPETKIENGEIIKNGNSYNLSKGEENGEINKPPADFKQGVINLSYTPSRNDLNLISYQMDMQEKKPEKQDGK